MNRSFGQKATEAPDREVAELQRAGFLVKPWESAEAIEMITGRPARLMRLFGHGTVEGLMEIKPDALNIIAFFNERPGNGQFPKAVRCLERVADDLGLTLRVVQFWNDRLCAWFARRG